MSRRRKLKMQYRYYQVPDGSPFLTLLGQKWVQSYGEEIDYLHFHNYMEFGYCYDGQGELVIADKSFRFEGGQFSVIPPNCPHTTNSDPGTKSRWEYLFVDVDKFLREIYPGRGNAKCRERMFRRINSCAYFRKNSEYPQMAGDIRKILDITREKKEFYLEEAKGVLISLLVMLARENKDEVQDKDMRPTEYAAAVTVVSDALDYINGHYMEPIRIEELADKCHISETHFRRAFSAAMNMAPLEYINMMRIQNACVLLKKTDDTISNIAYKCGFSTLSTFNRNFKQVTGESPMEWRKQPDHYEQQILQFIIHSERGW